MFAELKRRIKRWLRERIAEDDNEDDGFLEVVVKDSGGIYREKRVRPLMACGIYLRCVLIGEPGNSEILVCSQQTSNPDKFYRIWKRMTEHTTIEWE